MFIYLICHVKFVSVVISFWIVTQILNQNMFLSQGNFTLISRIILHASDIICLYLSLILNKAGK